MTPRAGRVVGVWGGTEGREPAGEEPVLELVPGPRAGAGAARHPSGHSLRPCWATSNPAFRPVSDLRR